MSTLNIDSEDIAEIKNALTVISLSAGTIDYHYPAKAEENLVVIREQVKRIDRLLPRIAFEEKEKTWQERLSDIMRRHDKEMDQLCKDWENSQRQKI